MKGLVITDKGLEDISLLEIQELIGVKGEVRNSAVIFDFEKIEDLYLLSYKGQSFFKVLWLIDDFRVKKDLVGEAKEKIKKVDFSKYLKKNQKFSVRCWRKKTETRSGEIEGEIGSVIPGKVDLEEAEVRFFVFVYDKEVYLGIDITGRDLSEREYKIFSHPNSLKGPLAYALVRMSGWDTRKIMLNCFCKSGEVGIEAALWGSGLAVNYYGKDKMGFKFDLEKFDKVKKKKMKIFCIDIDNRSLSATKKNAKIAGVNQQLQVSKIKIEDLDVKFREKEVDCLIGQVNKREEIDKTKELFYQANFVLKDKLVICCDEKLNLDDYAQEYKFKKREERIVERGGTKYKMAVYSK